MGWSDWYNLTEDEIKKTAPDNEGVYRIALPGRHTFVLIEEDNRRCYWLGIIEATKGIDENLSEQEPIRVCDCNYEKYRTVCTDVIYIGQTTYRTIKERLLEHLRGQ